MGSLCAHCELPGLTLSQESVTVTVTVEGRVSVAPAVMLSLTMTAVLAATTLPAVCERQETVLTPLAPLQGLLSLLQTFPQSGVLAATEDVERTQCRISSSYAFPCVFTRGTNYFSGPELAR